MASGLMRFSNPTTLPLRPGMRTRQLFGQKGLSNLLAGANAVPGNATFPATEPFNATNGSGPGMVVIQNAGLSIQTSKSQQDVWTQGNQYNADSQPLLITGYSGAGAVMQLGCYINSSAPTNGIAFGTTTAHPLSLQANGQVFVSLNQTQGTFQFGTSFNMAWGTSTIATPDIHLKRVVAKVLGVGDGSSGNGWLQNGAARARNTADVTNVTTTLASLSDLSLTLIAGRKYTGRIALCIDEGLAADGFKLDLNGGTATMTSIEYGFSSAIGATLGTRTSTALATAITLTALTDTNDVWVVIEVTMVVNAAGTFIPRQAKNADAAGGTLTTRLGSYIWLEDMPN